MAVRAQRNAGGVQGFVDGLAPAPQLLRDLARTLRGVLDPQPVEVGETGGARVRPGWMKRTGCDTGGAGDAADDGAIHFFGAGQVENGGAGSVAGEGVGGPVRCSRAMRAAEDGIGGPWRAFRGVIVRGGPAGKSGKPQDAKGVLAVDAFSTHHLRHTWATRAAGDGTTLARLQNAGGWSSPGPDLRCCCDTWRRRRWRLGCKLLRSIAVVTSFDPLLDGAGPYPKAGGYVAM
jgi:hypothetical protein